MEKEKWKDVNCKCKLCVSLCVGMGMVEKCGWGFLEGRKEKEKWKEDMKRKNWIENEMKINGDGYGKKIGGRKNGDWGGVYINE